MQNVEIKTFKDKILVEVDLNQKSDMKVTTEGGLSLWMNQNFGWDGKISQPVLATVHKDSSRKVGLRAGDVIVCHHNTFNRNVSGDYMYGDTGVSFREDGRQYHIYSINESDIQCRIDPNSGMPYPMPGFMLVERIPIQYPTSFIVTPATDKYIANQFKVIKPGTGDVKVKAGQVVITYEKSDYSINYNYRGKLFSAVRVKHSDVLAVSDRAYQPGAEWMGRQAQKSMSSQIIKTV